MAQSWIKPKISDNTKSKTYKKTAYFATIVTLIFHKNSFLILNLFTL